MTSTAYFIVYLDKNLGYEPIRFGIFSEMNPTTIGAVVTRVLAQCDGNTYEEAHINLMKQIYEAEFNSYKMKK